jgi:amino acid transporter
MYAFAPLSLAALRRSDPTRTRPYRLPAAALLAPLGFVAANLILYWSGWKTDSKLFIAILAGLAILAVTHLVGAVEKRPSFDWRASVWIWPWLGGMALITWLGQFDGRKVIPFWFDMVLVAAFSLAIFYWALSLALPQEQVRAYLDAQKDEEATEKQELAAEG